MEVSSNQDISGEESVVSYTNVDEMCSSPLLVEETRGVIYPYSLYAIISSIPSPNVGVHEIFASVIYVIAVECGFHLTADDSICNLQNCYCDIRKLRNIECLQYDQWKHNSETFIITLYLGSDSSFPCQIYFIPLSGLLVVNVYSAAVSMCYSLVFNPDEYVKLPPVEDQIRFHNLKYLSDSCKNNLFVPLKTAILMKCAVQSASLIGCNEDILLNIIKYLETNSIKNLRNTCFCLRNALRSYF